jgi:hypothetical protein
MARRLPPFLGESFTGSTSLVDVGVDIDPRYLATLPRRDPRRPLVGFGRAADWTTSVADHGKCDPVTQVQKHLQLRYKVFPKAEEVLKEVTNLRQAFKRKPGVRHLDDDIGAVEAHEAVHVGVSTRVEDTPSKLQQVGGRRLLRHRSASIPERGA